MNRRLLIGIAALAIVVVAVFFGWTAAHRPAIAAPQAQSATDAKPNVKLATAKLGDYVERIDAQGRIGPPAGSSAKLAFAQAGIIASVDVHVGDTVRAGQTVAALDRATLAAALAQAQADASVASSGYGGGTIPASNVASARAKLAVAREKLATLQRGGPAALSSRIAAQSVARQATLKVTADRTTLARDQSLFAGGVLARKDVEAARGQLDSDLADLRAADSKVAAAGADFSASLNAARADVASAENDLATARAQSGILGGQAGSARARLEAARIAYGNGLLAAPSDGVVLSISKHAGESVDPTQPVMDVGPALGRGVTLSVPAGVARRIAVGNPVTLQMPQTREVVTRGRVTAVVPAVDPTTQLATVVVSGAPADVVVGDAVTATIVVGNTPGIIVPSTAIVQDPQTGKTVVFVRDDHPKKGESGFALREVAVRASDAQHATISSGLKAGEQIAAQGGYTLLAPAGG